MRLPLEGAEIRSWQTADLASLVEHANNKNVSIHLRDRFPYPYTRKDGQGFIRAARTMQPETLFAIAVDGAAVGGIGFHLQKDIERVSAEIGYWLGERFWGQGIASQAIVAMTRYALDRHELTRLYALVADRNPASSRVLEKAGYVLEGRLRRSAIKNGIVSDQLLFAFIAEDRLLPPA
jgi:ribosomal-protein-alanine N-acetyltransferase